MQEKAAEVRQHVVSLNKHLEDLFLRQRAAFRREGAPSARQRQVLLQRLYEAVSDNLVGLEEAVNTDFANRSKYETRLLEIFPSLQGIKYARRNLRRWMKGQRRGVSIWFKPGRAQVMYQPLGVVGVIAPWNYPLYLAIGPLTCALAAGNKVMVKMSEFTPNTAEAFESLIGATFGEDEIAVVTGGADVGQAFSRLGFDHLLFTGSTAVGRQVMQAAAETLTPVTLELGGKSPAIIGPDADLNRAVQRLMLGKLLNAGQTCVAPDYVLLPQGTERDFVDLARAATAKLYPDPSSPDYTCVVNAHHYQRLRDYLVDAQEHGAELIELCPTPASGYKLSPTLLLNVNADMRIMQEEIFGPLLPVVGYSSLEQAITYVNERPRPLALYYFGRNSERIRQVLHETVSGGVTINDTMLHVAQDDLPFGGVGPSGMGRYHGQEGFETFSNKKAIFSQSRITLIPLLYPPYTRLTDLMLRILLR